MKSYFRIFYLLILSFIKYSSELSKFIHEADDITNLELVDVNNSLLIDGFPVYFYCKFTIFKKNFTILFKRIEKHSTLFDTYSVLDAHQIIFDKQKNLFKSYESVLVEVDDLILKDNSSKTYLVNSILFLNTKSFEIFVEDFSSNFNDFLSIWLKNFAKQNIIEIFDIMLNIFVKSSDESDETLISVNFDSPVAIKASSKQHTPKVYRGYSNYFKSFSNKMNKRSSINKKSKINLVVEACVHIEASVYNQVKNYLKTNNSDYIRMFFSLQFSHRIFIVDKIYQSINDPDLSIRIELKEIVFHNKKNEKKSNQDGQGYFRQTINYMNKYFASIGEMNKCDHIFYVHSYVFGATLGLASVGNICNYQNHIFTSTQLYLPYSEVIFAHELGHNLGAMHDTQEISAKYACAYETNRLMWPFMLLNYSAHTFSDCTIKQFKLTLLDKKNNLKDEFECLNKENFKRNISSKVNSQIVTKLPGYHYSLSDQCRMIMNNTESYACSDYYDCETLSCAHKNKCIEKSSPLDGTYCMKDKICLFFKCVDPHLSDVKDSGEVFPKLFARKKYQNKFERSAQLLANYCPYGAVQETHAILNPCSAINGFNLFQKHKNCEKMLSNRASLANNKNVCLLGHVSHLICCERCIKFMLNKCQTNSCGKIPTCETLKTNPCFNDGKCITNQSLINSATADVAFTCICTKGYTGPLCLSFDPCSLNPCEEYEICLQFGELGTYECLCSTEHSKYPFCSQRKYFLRRPVNTIVYFLLFICILIINCYFIYSCVKSFIKNKFNFK